MRRLPMIATGCEMKKSLLMLAAVPALLLAPAANAAILIDETNTPNPGTGYSFNVTAATNNTTLSFGGYQLPSFSGVSAISVTALGSMANLLGQSWTFTPAGCGSLADQGDDGAGTGTNGLSFGGVCAGSYDVFSQNFASAAGQQYLVSFFYSNPNGASGFRAETSAALTAAVPEPAAWALMLLGFAVVGGMMRSSNRKTHVTVRYA